MFAPSLWAPITIFHCQALAIKAACIGTHGLPLALFQIKKKRDTVDQPCHVVANVLKKCEMEELDARVGRLYLTFHVSDIEEFSIALGVLPNDPTM